MLELTALRENSENIIAGLEKKCYKTAREDVEMVISLDVKRRNIQTELDETLSKSNQISKQIGALMKEGKREEAEQAKAQTASFKSKTNDLRDAMKVAEEELNELLYKLPNAPHESVPQGNSDEDNIVLSEHGQMPELHENAQPHWELIKKYDIIDFELGNTITGAGFPVYKGKGAKLQRALISFFLDEAENAGYNEVQVPHLINKASGFGTGQLPDKDGQMYHVTEYDLYLIPTAEVPITNMYRDTIINKADLPIKNTGYTPCFRSEAGSWGADVRGLNRLHQFDKVEIVQIIEPEKSYEALGEMKAHIQSILEKLNLHYRVLNLCGGDVSVASAITYDMEVYSAAQKRWLEVSSVSNFETYQANRLKLRYKEAGDKKTQLLHTLNGSALALPRIVAAILENNQTPEGIIIPEVLRPYTRFDIIN